MLKRAIILLTLAGALGGCAHELRGEASTERPANTRWADCGRPGSARDHASSWAACAGVERDYYMARQAGQAPNRSQSARPGPAS